MTTERITLDQSGHAHGHDLIDHLYIHEHTRVHQLASHLKVIGALTFIFVVVATPSAEYWAYLGYLLILLTVAKLAHLRYRILAKRMLIEIPFVFFAILIPFATPGERIEVLGISVSPEGLWVAFGILTKSTLGVMTSIILSATTQSRELLNSFQKLKVPDTLIQIASFMFRYTAVVIDELNRMKIARQSRGFEAKGLRDWRILGQSIGALFIRSYERGERVHLAMLSRGYEGKLLLTEDMRSTATEKIFAFMPAIIAVIVQLIVRNIS